jgi:hypothetical protein
MTRLSLVALLSAGVISCSPPVRTCTSTAECALGQTCLSGQCRGAAGNTGGSDAGNATGGSGTGNATGGSGAGMATGGGSAGGSTIVTGCDPMALDNGARDTDCDGLTDLEEYGTDYGNGARTDPCNSDTDMDGLPDGLEMGKTSTVNATCGMSFIADADGASKTNPTLGDTDGDGLKDGEEDLNQDGRRDGTEPNPLRVDTDCDGYSDKQEVRDMAAGCATNPTVKDTDGDGLTDGVEGKLQPPGADAMGCRYVAATTFDANPATGTNACSADSDGDGVQDGAEDTNSNGRVDMGELDPNNAMDAMGPAQQACATANLRPVQFHSSALADVQLALVPEFMEVSKLTLNNGERGIAFYNPVTKVAGIAYSKTMGVAGDATGEENAGRGTIGGIGSLSSPITQTYSTWDGFTAIRATYDVNSPRDGKDFANELARRFIGMGVGGTLPGTAGSAGPFKVQAVYVRRTATRAVAVIAAIPTALYTGQALFQLDDVGGGTAVAQSGDLTATQCEVFNATVNAKVDFLWVVDDSCSMGGYQAAIGNAASVFSQKLQSAGLDWRAGAVTTGYWSMLCTRGTTPFCFRPFTNNTQTMQSWFSQSGGAANWFGTSGDADERLLESSRTYIQNVLLPRSTNATANKVRDGANLHLLLLGDADDQSNVNLNQLNSFYANFDGQGGRAVLHGIVCPQGQSCGETQANPRRNLAAIAASSGVLGDINVAQNNSPALANTIDAILSAAIGGTGRQLQRPPISATIKVAIEAGQTTGMCNANDVPRSRQNGWDIDSATRRIVFYGACIPRMTGVKVAVSYRYWIDNSPDPNGDPCGATCVAPFVCDPNSRSCVCAPNCGNTCGASLTCRQASCTCEPSIQ